MLQFGELPAEVMRIFINIKYTLKNTRVKVDLKNYISKIIKLIQIYNIFPQLNIVDYNITI